MEKKVFYEDVKHDGNPFIKKAVLKLEGFKEDEVACVVMENHLLPSFIRVSSIEPAEDLPPQLFAHKSTFQKAVGQWLNWNVMDKTKNLEDGAKVFVVSAHVPMGNFSLAEFLNISMNEDRCWVYTMSAPINNVKFGV